MMTETQKLTEQLEQQQLSVQLLQKMKLIQGDLEMNRNHRENLAWLINFSGDLDKRIAKEMLLGNKITGFVELKDEVQEWIDIVTPLI